jgi:hypothetical protein
MLCVALAACALVFSRVDAQTPQDYTPVKWVNAVNATPTSGGLRKTAGCSGCEDAGAASQQSIAHGDAFVSFTVADASAFWAAGLSHGNSNDSYADIDFAFRFSGNGWADVIENGVAQFGGDIPYTVGDVFRVAVVRGRVQYSKNGVLLRESDRAPEYPLLLDASLASMGATIDDARIGVAAAAPAYGGFLEKAGSPTLRSRFARSQIDAFLPANGAKGPFTFPAPYLTTGVRLTNASDCAGGQDCVWYVGYSYWRNTNYHVGQADMLIFLGFDRAYGGAGPSLLSYNKATDQVQNLGPLFDSTNTYSYATGEGWYFSGSQPTKLYVYLVGDATLERFDVLTHRFEPRPVVDVRRCPRPSVCPNDATYIIQPHSSDDDRVHSMTLQNPQYERLGCLVFESQGRRYRYFPPPGGFYLDECHIDKSGRFLTMLEGDQNGSMTTRVADLQTGIIASIDDAAGSLGHLDTGYSYAVGADNYNPMANATILLKFPVTNTQRPVGPVVHFNKRWDIAAANHIAHGSAVNAPAESQYACGSNASRVADMADEIVCFSLDPNRNADGSIDVLVAGQVLTDLDALGGRDFWGDDYSQMPKGNLDVTGKYFIWTSNMRSDRLDAFIVKIPSQWFATARPTSTSSDRRR